MSNSLLKNILLIIINIFPIITLGQEIKILEPTILEVEYNRQMVRDTLERKSDFMTDIVRLRIGKETSMFYAPGDLWYDSLSCNQKLKTQLFLQYSRSNGKLPSPGGLYRKRIYKNYPEGKVTVFNHFDLAHWTYTEDWGKPKWELLDSTKTILNLPCQLAVTSYRGRVWYAWFTLDIPISDGPWKLCGLPGLILEAYDEKEDYLYTTMGIYQDHIPDVGIYNYSEYDWLKTDRIRYLKTWYKAINTNMGAKVSQMYNLNFKAETEVPVKLKHRNYDLEETDYHDK